MRRKDIKGGTKKRGVTPYRQKKDKPEGHGIKVANTLSLLFLGSGRRDGIPKSHDYVRSLSLVTDFLVMMTVSVMCLPF